MATRSFIAQKLPSGSFRAVYCHWDGYPENNGVILHSHYFNTPMVEELLALGSLSSLGERANPTLSTHSYDKPQDDVTVAYHRDRGEDLRPASDYADLAALKAACSEAGGEFLYIWDGASWSVDGKPLADVLAEANLLPETDLFTAQPEAAPAGPDWAVLGPRLATALGIAATTLETVYRERDPANIAAKCAAKGAREALALIPSA